MMIVILLLQLVINEKSDSTIPVPKKPAVRPPKKKLLEWSKQIVTWRAQGPAHVSKCFLLSTIAWMHCPEQSSCCFSRSSKTPQEYQCQHFATYEQLALWHAQYIVRLIVVDCRQCCCCCRSCRQLSLLLITNRSFPRTVGRNDMSTPTTFGRSL
jgi:hypothetical protein